MGLLMGLGLAFGALGAGFNIFQGWNRSQQEQAEIRARQEEERRMREAQIAEQRAAAEREINYAKSVFKIEQEDAFRKADDIWHQGERIDMRADLDETLTGRAFNLAIKQSNAQDESLLHQEQRGKQNFQNTQGAFKAALGTSGVRAGANSSEGLLSQNEENFNQDLALMKKQRETQKEISLMSAFSNLKGGMFRIDEERDAANKAFRDSKQLRDDYSEGGRAVNLFNQKIANRRADLQGSINLQNLGGESLNNKLCREPYDRAAYSFLDGLTDLFGGFGSGFNFGSNIAGFAKNWGGGSFGGRAGNFGSTAAALANYKRDFSDYKRKYRGPYMNMF